MSKLRVAALVFFVGVAAVGVAACSSNSSSSTTTAAATNTKTVFCGYNTTLDKGSSSVSSAADFLAYLKANQTLLNNLSNSIPNDSIKAQATTIINAAKAAVASNNANALSSPAISSAGAAVDTYCGTDGGGNPLPANFGTGKGSTFCADEATLSSGLGNAATPADAVTFLKANQAKITEFAANIPSAVQSDAQTLVTAANAAIAANDGTLIQTQAVSTAGNNVDLYCGVNH
ncbi:MAG TPA: hypothetical protein VG014_11585 [Acidimicrobiales bacterium]|jgi:hypothetical protein|nr:hypothetical protein [Acidimicrobiales bacterium]